VVGGLLVIVGLGGGRGGGGGLELPPQPGRVKMRKERTDKALGGKNFIR